MEPNPMQNSHSTAVSSQSPAFSRRGARSRFSSPTSGLRPLASSRHTAFTLTELLIVIAIIAVLAGLIGAAAVNALRASRRNAIVLEIKNISAAIENFRTDYGAYPPNGMSNAVAANDFNVSGSPGALVKADFVRMFKKAFPRHQEPQALIEAMAGFPPNGTTVVRNGPLVNGMRGNEALVFWLGGFSSNEQYPISGEGGPSFVDVVNGEVLEDRNRRYEFDLGLLGPRNDAGGFDDGPNRGRFITYTVDTGNGNQNRRINFWQFTPKGSEQPLVYFDVSRHKPGTTRGRYDAWAANPAAGFPYIYALKQLREGVSVATSENDLAFVNQGKFQLIHAGLDGDWGDESYRRMGFWTTPTPPTVAELTKFPIGPYIGPIADNLSNFTDGTLEDASEE